eukprot:3148599-Heterocapsa_arctica.AAC.1
MTSNVYRARVPVAGDLRVGAGVVEELLFAHFAECHAALSCHFALLVLFRRFHHIPPESLVLAGD